jgi:hypothetical protein
MTTTETRPVPDAFEVLKHAKYVAEQIVAVHAAGEALLKAQAEIEARTTAISVTEGNLARQRDDLDAREAAVAAREAAFAEIRASLQAAS